MKVSQKVYCYTVIFIGCVIGFICVRQTVLSLGASGHFAYDILSLILLSIVYIACNCLPLHVNENVTIDMTFMVIVAMVMTRNYESAVLIIIIAAPFYYEKDLKTNKVLNIFNIPPIKTLFNLANYIITTYIGGMIFKSFGGIIGNLQLPQVLLPYISSVILMILINTVTVLLLFYLEDKKALLMSLLSALRSFIVNMIAAAPIGFFFAVLLNMDGGIYLSILFTIPMLLARYAFKLYIKSKIQYEEMIRAFAKTIELKDPYTIGHSVRVEQYSLAIGIKMGLLPTRLEKMKVAALLHDIGKIGIDDRILNKPSILTGEERKQIQAHPENGTKILENLTIDEKILVMIKQHHERYDAGGYPGHVASDKILLESAIISVADAFDAMTSDRPYRKGLDYKKAFEIIKEESGAQFSPEVVKAFFKTEEEIINIYEQLKNSEDAFTRLMEV